MKTLIETPLFIFFASYLNGSEPVAGELPAAYDHFVTSLAELSQDGELTGQLRRLNYTKIELAFMQQTCNGMTETHRHVLYDVFLSKTLALLDAEAEMIKEMLRYGGLSAETCRHADMERYGQRLDRAGSCADGCRCDRYGRRSGIEGSGCDTDIRGSVSFENQCPIYQAWKGVRPLYGHHSVHRLPAQKL